MAVFCQFVEVYFQEHINLVVNTKVQKYMRVKVVYLYFD